MGWGGDRACWAEATIHGTKCDAGDNWELDTQKQSPTGIHTNVCINAHHNANHSRISIYIYVLKNDYKYNYIYIYLHVHNTHYIIYIYIHLERPLDWYVFPESFSDH